jgi:outer membrane protein assembly factor BamA
VTATLSVETGDKYKIKRLRVKGAESLSALQQYRLPTPRTGESYSRAAVYRVISALYHIYADKGFSRPIIVPVMLYDDAAKEVEIVLNVDESSMKKVSNK